MKFLAGMVVATGPGAGRRHRSGLRARRSQLGAGHGRHARRSGRKTSQVRGIGAATRQHDRRRAIADLEFLGAFCRVELDRRRCRRACRSSPISPSTPCATSTIADGQDIADRVAARARCACSRPRRRHCVTTAAAPAIAARRSTRRRLVARRHRRCGLRRCVALIAVPGARHRAAAVARCCRRASRTRTASSSGSPTTSAYFSTPALVDSVWNSIWRGAADHGDRAAAGLRLRLRAARARCMPREGAVPGAGAAADLRAVAAAGDLADLPVRQPGLPQGAGCSAARSTARSASSWRRSSTASRTR